jgi:hypothetical protein
LVSPSLLERRRYRLRAEEEAAAVEVAAFDRPWLSRRRSGAATGALVRAAVQVEGRTSDRAAELGWAVAGPSGRVCAVPAVAMAAARGAGSS